jgi:FkbM family methyltransferase
MGLELVYDVQTQPMNTDAAWGSFAPKGMLRVLLDMTHNLPYNWLGKRVFYALRRVGRMQLAGKPVDVTRLGARLRLTAERNVCEGRILFNPDYFDARERRFLGEHLPESPVFIDAGANIGGYGFYVCHVRPKAQVISIEAQENTFRKLAFNARQNPHMNINPVNCALADTNGTVRLFINDANSGETSIRVRKASHTTVDVKAITLLKLAQDFDLPRIDAIKLDIEGAEDIVLKSFFETAPEHLFPRVILIENSVQRWTFNVIDFLKGFRYLPIRDFGGNVVLERKPDA